MTALATAFVEGRIDTRRFPSDIRSGMNHSSVRSSVDDEGKKAGKRYTSAFGSTLKIGASIAAGFAVVKGVEFLKGAVSEASNLGETINKTNVIFGRNANEILNWSKQSATAFGLSRNEALGAAAQFGNMFQQLGFTGKAATATSESVVKMAADLGSFNNVDPSDVLDRIGASLRGEYDSLQQLIPNINAARVEQVALAQTGKSSADALTAQEKAAATLAIIHKDGAAAANDFAETSGGLANQQRILSAQFDNMKAAVGAQLLPVITKFFTFLNTEGLPALTQVGGVLKDDVIPAVGSFAGFLRDHIGTIKILAGVTGALVIGLGAYRATVIATMVAEKVATVARFISIAATQGLTAAQTELNVAMSLNPIGLVVAALAVLAVGLVVAYKRSDTFREVVDRAFTVTKKAAQGLVAFFRTTWPIISAVVKRVMDFVVGILKGSFDVIRGIFKTGLALIRGDWSGAWDGIKLILRGAWNVLNTILGGSLERAKDILARAWGSIGNAAGRAWNGIVRIVKSAWSEVKKAVGSPIFFVLDTIINDKLLGGFNWLADKVNAPNIPNIPTGGIPHYWAGGNTGPGSKYQPAGIVHAGEHVWTQEEMARFPGGHKAMEQMRAALMRGYASGGIVWPLPGGVPSTYAGHDGVDLNIPGGDYGKPFLAAASGTISYVGWGRGYGDAIFERGNYGELVYGHSSRPLVRTGQRVSAGQVIGLVGSTGHSTGPHLHFGFPGGTYAQALAFLSGAENIQGIGASFTGGSTWDKLSSFAQKALQDPLTYLKDRITGPLSSMGSGGLIDIFKGIPLALLSGLADKIKSAATSFVPDPLKQLGRGPFGTGVKFGVDALTPFDSGGLLAPGYTLAYNGTGAYETVRTRDQERRLSGSSRGPLVHIDRLYAVDMDDAARKIERRQREALTIAGGT